MAIGVMLERESARIESPLILSLVCCIDLKISYKYSNLLGCKRSNQTTDMILYPCLHRFWTQYHQILVQRQSASNSRKRLFLVILLARCGQYSPNTLNIKTFLGSEE